VGRKILTQSIAFGFLPALVPKEHRYFAGYMSFCHPTSNVKALRKTLLQSTGLIRSSTITGRLTERALVPLCQYLIIVV